MKASTGMLSLVYLYLGGPLKLEDNSLRGVQSRDQSNFRLAKLQDKTVLGSVHVFPFSLPPFVLISCCTRNEQLLSPCCKVCADTNSSCFLSALMLLSLCLKYQKHPFVFLLPLPTCVLLLHEAPKCNGVAFCCITKTYPTPLSGLLTRMHLVATQGFSALSTWREVGHVFMVVCLRTV